MRKLFILCAVLTVFFVPAEASFSREEQDASAAIENIEETMITSGNYREALYELDMLVSTDMPSARSQTAQGIAYYGLMEYGRALEIFKNARMNDPEKKVKEMLGLWEELGVDFGGVAEWIDQWYNATRVAQRFRREEPDLTEVVCKIKSLRSDGEVQMYEISLNLIKDILNAPLTHFQLILEALKLLFPHRINLYRMNLVLLESTKIQFHIQMEISGILVIYGLNHEKKKLNG